MSEEYEKECAKKLIELNELRLSKIKKLKSVLSEYPQYTLSQIDLYLKFKDNRFMMDNIDEEYINNLNNEITELKESDKHDVLYNLELKLRKDAYKIFNRDYIEKELNKTLLQEPKSLSHRLELYIYNYNEIHSKNNAFLADIKEIDKIFLDRKKTIIIDKLKDIQQKYNGIIDLKNVFMRRYDSKIYKARHLDYEEYLIDIFHQIQIFDTFGIRKYFLENVYYEDEIQQILSELNSY